MAGGKELRLEQTAVKMIVCKYIFQVCAYQLLLPNRYSPFLSRIFVSVIFCSNCHLLYVSVENLRYGSERHTACAHHFQFPAVYLLVVFQEEKQYL